MPEGGLYVLSPSRRATIIYPILLSDRTALLVSAADGILELVSVPVGREVVETEARALRAQLERQATRRYLAHAQRLYDWLSVVPWSRSSAPRGRTRWFSCPMARY